MRKTYSTVNVARGARVRYWNDLHNTLLAPIEIRAYDRTTFNATACVTHLGPLRIVKTESAPATVEHGARHLARTQRRNFRIVLSASGSFGLEHERHTAVIGQGDFVLLDDAAPYRIRFSEPNTALCLAVAPTTLRTYLPDARSLCGIPMAVDRPLNKVVSTMVIELWQQIEAQLPEAHRTVLAKTLLQVVAASYASEQAVPVERSIVAAARRTAIKRHVDLHLRQPELGPRSIAAAFGISRRYLRLLFAEENDSVTAYVRRRRLEQCAWELAERRWLGRSVAATAAAWGFGCVVAFARAFKAQYGATPTTYRRTRLESANGRPAYE